MKHIGYYFFQLTDDTCWIFTLRYVLPSIPDTIHSFLPSISWKVWTSLDLPINWNRFSICWKCQSFSYYIKRIWHYQFNWILEIKKWVMQLRKTWHFQQIESRFQLIENKNEWIVIDMDVKTRSENWLYIKNIQQNYQLIEKCRRALHYLFNWIQFLEINRILFLEINRLCNVIIKI